MEDPLTNARASFREQRSRGALGWWWVIIVVAGFPAAAGAQTGSSSQSPSAASADGQRLALMPSWKEPYGGKAHSIADLKKILEPVATKTLDSNPYPKLRLLPGVHYLMPFTEAREALKLGDVVASNGIGTPGFPHRTLHYKAFDGNFGSGFNRLYQRKD